MRAQHVHMVWHAMCSSTIKRHFTQLSDSTYLYTSQTIRLFIRKNSIQVMKKFLAIVVLAAVCNAAVLETRRQVRYSGIDEGLVKFFEDNHLTTTQKMEVLRHIKYPVRYRQQCFF